ncbi:MAG TPA: D-glycero-beta-D-manno-heptose 1-phosphate adenylyltransferase [Actinophytocola sp.]|uniref:D-glycero-beta-D-manno-heptose 1-phosphate adenylyltransferase n=1 Tax=Actinophytocola sp. TaxID=1872138 RepID=UPI002DDCC948|nr:D-glycero-beta-D-manno-heptose 1-phosphate adenylyltransferase [Actinophytocola sp.]HEV2778909.1 D-glycero-beta-D-manno-heptose 1-phosphate adenylyltransferase [Actinophytocola sp.]
MTELTAGLPGMLADRRPRIVVIGDAILDEWLSGRANRLCREAPAPVVDVARRTVAPGGAANTAVNLAALGADVRLVTAVGDDEGGRELVAELESAGVRTDGVTLEPGRRTVAKRRIVAAEQVMLRVDEGDHHPLPAAEVRAALSDCDAVVLCDYGLGALDGGLLETLMPVRDDIPLLVVDAHRVDRWRALRPDLVTPNAEEAAALLDDPLPAEPGKRASFLAVRGDRLREATGAGTVVVTIDRDGAILLPEGEPTYRTWADPAPDSQTTGAGDTFCAALTVARCCGLSWTLSVELAQAAADVVVHRPGTAVCTVGGLTERLASFHGAALDAPQLAAVVREHRAAGRRIVFTNGCFDVVHRGHVAYLNQAKALGDVLVVAINSDASVAKLKGPGRPVNTAADRAAVLAALSCVDHVTVFDERKPVELLRLLRPEIYAKGGDYTPEMLAETGVVRAYGGEVKILDYVPDHSTSAVIERIRSG